MSAKASEAAEKMTTRITAFECLPDEIIEQILLLTTPNVFASLIILNTKWRTVSQQAHLYAHHLSRCPSYAAAHHSIPAPVGDDSLPQLRRLFAREIKRNLFEAYLRPQELTINLVSTSISSASAPGGEAFQFSLSPRGHYVLAYSSSRIHVLDVMGSEVVVRRELKILRRPASTTITDDGKTLAVLSTDLQVDIYDLSGEHAEHSRVVSLDHAPRTIALSPDGSVLAAAYDSGVEVSSLDPDCINTDRRAVKCYAVDSLSFSRDGTQLLGSTNLSKNPSTVVLTAPYYNPISSLPEESISALWTTSILFPNGSRDCSHAVLLPSAADDEASWTFTYDRVFETFRAVRIDDLRNGTTYFTGPTAELGKLLPSTVPAASETGELVTAGFQGCIWLYGVPEDLDAPPAITGPVSNTDSEVSTPLSQSGRRNSAVSSQVNTRPREGTSRTPQWQLLCDKFRNTFVEGRKIACLNGVNAIHWVSDNSLSYHKERLVAVAPGIGIQTEDEDDGMSPTDGGRISILDFDYSTNDGRKKVITIEVGDQEPDILEEEHRDIAAEVALVRRRTVAQRRGAQTGMSSSATAVARPMTAQAPPMPPLSSLTGGADPFAPTSSVRRRQSQATTTTVQSETTSIDDEEAFDAPYSQTSPRSGPTLRRAATAAATNRRLNPRTAALGHIEYRRADGREEHPHESDADHWVPPPPPYTKDPIPPLPEHIQRSILAENAAAPMQRSNTHRAPSIDFPGLDGNSLHRSRTLASVSSGESRRYPFNRARSESATRTLRDVSIGGEFPRPATSPRSGNFDDLYDVSPPGSPQHTLSSLPFQAPSEAAAHQIPRRPVGGSADSTVTLASPVSPLPVMRATIQQPVSPIPQPQAAPDTVESRLQDWETTSEVFQDESIKSRPIHSSSPISLTRERLDQNVPPRPTEDHRLSEVPPTTPVLIDRRQEIEAQPTPLSKRAETEPLDRSSSNATEEEPKPLSQRAGTAPAAPIRNSSIRESSSDLMMPSADQMARLRSRQGRPPSQVLTDPSRRLSGGFLQAHNRLSSGADPSSWGARGSTQGTPPRITSKPPSRSTPPRAAHGAHGSSQNAPIYPPQSSRSNSPQQYQQHPQQLQPRPFVSNSYRDPGPQSHNRQSSTGSPSHRPNFNRMDTIHSMGSTGGEHSPWVAPKQMTLGRHPSRAERSAAKNIKDAKKKGWRASMRTERGKVKKERGGDGASSAGWTDVSREEGGMNRTGEKGKGVRCVIM